MIFVDAPGFRPTAVAAAPPIRPTPIAAPNAARATCKLPVIGFILSVVGAIAPNIAAVSMSAVRDAGPGLLVVADQEREDGGEQHEDQRLHQADQQLHEVKRDGQ